MVQNVTADRPSLGCVSPLLCGAWTLVGTELYPHVVCMHVPFVVYGWEVKCLYSGGMQSVLCKPDGLIVSFDLYFCDYFWTFLYNQSLVSPSDAQFSPLIPIAFNVIVSFLLLLLHKFNFSMSLSLFILQLLL